MNMIVACVCKKGGDFNLRHVHWLRRQVEHHMPNAYFQSWTDMNYGIPLLTTWPRWWAKMEVYGDTYEDPMPMLMVDLDTVFLKSFDVRSEHADKALIMRDPWKNGQRFPERLGGGFMYLPRWARQRLFDNFSKNTIAECGDNDQVYLHNLFKDDALRIQDHYLDQLVSYKVHVQGMGLQDDNRVVYFHGQPRPWDVDEPWIPKLGA